MFSRQSVLFICVLLLVGILTVGQVIGLAASATVPRVQLPLLITSSGQSPDAMMVKMVCDNMDLPADYDPIVEPIQLGSDLGTLIIAIGHSMKGLGAAGVDEDADIARINKVIDTAQKADIFIIAVHIGGQARRGSIADRFIATVVPRSDLAIVMEEGDEDKFFTELTEVNNIPMISIEEILDLSGLLEQMFEAK